MRPDRFKEVDVGAGQAGRMRAVELRLGSARGICAGRRADAGGCTPHLACGQRRKYRQAAGEGFRMFGEKQGRIRGKWDWCQPR